MGMASGFVIIPENVNFGSKTNCGIMGIMIDVLIHTWYNGAVIEIKK